MCELLHIRKNRRSQAGPIPLLDFSRDPQDPDFQKIVERPVVRFDFCVKRARPSHSPEVLARPLGPRVGPMDTGRLVTADHGVATRGPRGRKGHAWSSITRRAQPPPLGVNALHAESIEAC
jgi:hypothetical protein